MMKRLYTILFALTLTFTAFAQSYEEMINKAMDLIEAKEDMAAEQALKAALRKEPTNPNNILLLVNLGTIQRNLGKFDEALISYNVAVETFPDNAFIRHNRASLYCEMNKIDEALFDYSSILLSNPKDLEALYRQALIYMNKKDLFSAEENFEKTIELAPKNLRGKMGIASIMKRRKEFKEAEEIYSYLIYEYKNVAELYFDRAECYIELDKLGRAQDDIKKAFDLGYTDSPIYILRGKVKFAQYEKQAAKEDFLKAKELGADSTLVDELLLLCK